MRSLSLIGLAVLTLVSMPSVAHASKTAGPYLRPVDRLGVIIDGGGGGVGPVGPLPERPGPRM
jgi:hypothetical protein